MENFKLYGNAELRSAVSTMNKLNKMPHSIVITGQKGMGKKTASRYIGASVLCENPVDGQPCGKCNSCVMLSHGGHPDFIEIKPSGKNGIYRLDDDLRPIIADAYIKPSQSKFKVVVISDMDNTQATNQNVLLKLVEEPPLHLIIIMTACAREYFLPTILSRVTHFKMAELDKIDLLTAVKECCGEEFSEEKFEKAYLALGGNCGKVVEYIQGTELAQAVEIVEDICVAICDKDEYGLMLGFAKADGNKKLFKEVLELFSKVLRDCVVKRSGGSSLTMLGVCKDRLDELSQKLSIKKAMCIFEICEEYTNRINGNGNLNLALSSICAEISEIL